MKFCPRCGQKLMDFDLEEKQRYMYQPEAPLKERNWFQRHLNWTWVLAYLLWFVINAYANDPFGIVWWLSLVAAIFCLIVSGWVIKQKGRRLWWLLLYWIGSPLWLKNKKSYRELTETEHFKSTQRKWSIAGVVVFVVGITILIIALVASPSTTPLPETPSSPSHGIPPEDLRTNTQYWNANHEEEALRIWQDKTYYEADFAWMADESLELEQILCSMNKKYHETHSYIEGEFDCNDMAVELWNIVHKQGIGSVIVVGNLDLDNESFAESDHAWLVVPYLYLPLFAVEPTNGEVCRMPPPDEESEFHQYLEGYYYTSPSNLRADIWERW